MKFFPTAFLLLIVTFSSFSQQADKVIKEEDVKRILQTLSSDAMMGRPSLIPARMEPATRFIEDEFKTIGLKPLKGLPGFRQEFEKIQVSPGLQEITVNGEAVSSENALVFSDKPEIDLSGGLKIKSIVYDSTAANVRQYFMSKAFELIRDTSSVLVIIDPKFQSLFTLLKDRFAKRFTTNGTFVKVFVLGKSPVDSYGVKVKQKTETIRLCNVVGMIEGKVRPDEYVVFSGHYDHMGIQQAAEGDSIANGADDDASGTTAVIELARYFRAAKSTGRTLLFVAFTAEEIGGFGSKYFSEQLNPDKVIAMFNIEMIGKPSKWGQNYAFITGYDKSDFGAILGKNLEGTAYKFMPDPYPQQDLFYRSDNATLARLGVPAHTISTDQIDIDKFYHTVNDEFETLDLQNITATIRAIALSARSIVGGADAPKRIDKTMVRN